MPDTYRTLEQVLREDVVWWRTTAKKVTNMQAVIHMHRRKQLDKGWINNEAADLMALAADGGGCPKCGVECDLIKVENEFADFHYFEPACTCYPHCPNCGESLAVEFAADKFAMRCGCGYGKKEQDQ